MERMSLLLWIAARISFALGDVRLSLHVAALCLHIQTGKPYA
jgi:hypothetical protein